LSENFEGYSQRYRESLFSAISAGFFFAVGGAIFLTTPNLFGSIVKFFSHFELVRVPNLEELRLPAPMPPLIDSGAFLAARKQVYLAVEQFSYVWGLFQIVILALRFVVRSPLNKKVETVSNIVFWFGAGSLTRTFLIETTRWSATTAWFVFWSGIIMLIGLSLIIRGIILAAVPTRYVS